MSLNVFHKSFVSSISLLYLSILTPNTDPKDIFNDPPNYYQNLQIFARIRLGQETHFASHQLTDRL